MPSKISIDRTKKFIHNYGVDIVKAISGTNLYFETVIGQKCNESGYGTSPIAVDGNNFGGIRNYGNLKGAIGKTKNGWAIFATPFDCFKTYVETLQTNKRDIVVNGKKQTVLRYAAVFAASSPEEQIKEMVKAGYCANITPEKYLSICQSAMDSARIIAPCGKIDNLTAAITLIQKNTV